MLLGTSKTIITPEPGVELAGFGRLNRRATGKYDDLHLTVFSMKQDQAKALIICADLIGFGVDYSRNLKEIINERFGFNEAEILLNASHTHSGPQTIENMNVYLGHMNDDYIKFLTDSVLSTVEAAVNSMEEVEIFRGRSYCSIGINRRLISNGKYYFAPNENGVMDREVTVLKFMANGAVKAVLFNYANHPSTIGTDNITADYPGIACSIVEESLGDNVKAAFIQGCCGNIRSRTVKDGSFRPGTYEDVKEFGKALGDSVIEACNSTMHKLTPKLSTKLIKLPLALRQLPSRDEYKEIVAAATGYRKVWAEKMLEEYDKLKPEITYTLQSLSLSDDTIIVGMEGEVCIEYDLYLKNKFWKKTFITAGYCNGNVGYIPTTVMFEQGGYEPADSIACYALPSRFTDEIEMTLTKGLDQLVK